MKQAACLSFAVLILLAGQAATAGAEEPRTLTGKFVWNQQDGKNDLEAVFDSTGEDKWDVAFHFSFRGKPHVYSGTAKGSLSEGALAGKVQNESRNRTFTFEGAFEDGAFRGTHSEIGRGGGTYETGTLTLRE